MSSESSADDIDPEARRVLAFWFGDADDADNIERRGRMWFAAGPADDLAIREGFGALHDAACRGALDGWRRHAREALALVVLLDQFTRCLYRASGEAFSQDERALALSRAVMERGLDRGLRLVERVFLYMPFQHAESRDRQRESVELYAALAAAAPPALQSFARNTYDYAVLHREIVERFGRFPHRNELLGRSSTREEEDYLEQGGHRFGQG